MKQRLSVGNMPPTADNMEMTSPVRKLSFGSSILTTGPAGFHVNLLANSLTTKLKQHRYPQSLDNNGDVSVFNKRSKPPKHPSHTDARLKKSILSRHEKRYSEDIHDFDGEGLNEFHHGDPGNDTSIPQQLPTGRSRTDSTTSEKYGDSTSARSKTSKSTGRRLNSAGQSLSLSSRSLSAPTDRTLSRAISSAIDFDSRGSLSTVKVVKRDGVFKPADKYASGRNVLREVGYPSQQGVACEYAVYTLPFYDDGGTTNDNESPMGLADFDKKRMKVSWNVFDNNVEEDLNLTARIDSRQDGNPTPSVQVNNSRPVSTDNFAFRRPVYIPCQSKVNSIGLKWTVPTPAAETPGHTEVIKKVEDPLSGDPANQKPMWSYLVTPEPKIKQQVQQNKPKKGRPKTTQLPHMGSSSNNSTTLGVRTGHSRDLHPVTTAMEREGTSISKTKWKVPSSVTTTLDAERAMMGRLQLVKRRGNRLLYERGTSNSAAQRFRESMFVETGGEESPDKFFFSKPESKKSERSRSRENLVDCASASTRRDFQSSPTKSRSTQN